MTKNEQEGEKAVVFEENICYNWKNLNKGRLREVNHEV
jgi:hypothetical protein